MYKLLSCAVSVVFVLFSPLSFALPSVQPEAEKVLKSAEAYLSTLKSADIEAVTTEEQVYNATHRLQFNGTQKILIQQPSQLSITSHSDIQNSRISLNEGVFTFFDEDVNVYAQMPAPGAMGDALAHVYSEYSTVSPGSELFSGRAYELLVGNASEVVYVGKGMINGNSCHHIAGFLTDMDWQLWVRADGDPELCKYIVTDRDIPNSPQYSMTFTKWKANPEMSGKLFKFEPPAGAEAIDIIK